MRERNRPSPGRMTPRSPRSRAVPPYRSWCVVFALCVIAPSALEAQNNTQATPPRRRAATNDTGDWRRSPRTAVGDTAPGRRSAIEVDSNDAGAPSSRSSAGEAPDPHLANGRQIWREYDLTPYTARLAAEPHPEQAVVEWILRQTGLETWHGEEVAVLAATRGKLRVYQTPDVQARIAEMTQRFTHSVQSEVSMRVEFVTCTDLSWRNGIAHLLKPIASGPDGQQVWLVAPEDAALIRERLRADRQARSVTDQNVLVNNGQPATVETGQAVNHITGLELMSGVYMAYQPVLGRLNEGVRATFAPLWLADGSGVDLNLKLNTRVVTKLHETRTVAPLTTGNQTTEVQVPEVAATSLDTTVRWPSRNVLLVSAGVQPGILRSRRGMLGLTGLGLSAELLVFAELDAPVATRTASPRLNPARQAASESRR